MEIVMSEIHKSIRTEVKEHDGYTCQVCGETGCKGCGYLHVHHIQHVSKGGKNEPNNLQTLCATDHSIVHNSDHVNVPSGTPAEYYTQEILAQRGLLEPVEPEEDHATRLRILKEKAEREKERAKIHKRLEWLKKQK